MAGPPCGGPVHCRLTCTGFGARSLKVGRYRRRNKVSTAAAGMAIRRARLEGKARGSSGRGVGASAQKIVWDIGTVGPRWTMAGFRARQVRTGQRFLAWSPVPWG